MGWKRTVILSASWLLAVDRPALAQAESDQPRSAGEATIEQGDEAKQDEPARPTGWFRVGAGFSTEDSFIATASMGNDNLLRTGNHLSLNAYLSGRRQLFLTRFVDPDVLGSDLSLGIDLFNDQREWPGFSRQAAGGAVTLSHPLGAAIRGFVSYRLEDVSVDPELAAVALRGMDGDPFGDLLRGGVLSSLRTGIVYSTVDDPALPGRGTNAGAYIEVADRRLGSQTELWRGGGWVQHHRPLAGPFTLHVRGGIDVVAPRGGLGVPLSERLQLGGSSDVRGYAPGSIGPTIAYAEDSSGALAAMPLGGNAKLAVQSELEFPIWQRLGLSGAVFFDAGSLYNLENRYCDAAVTMSPGASACGRDGFGSLHTSVGFGLIWRSPIGPVRLDMAFPLDRGLDASTAQFLFSLGTSF